MKKIILLIILFSLIAITFTAVADPVDYGPLVPASSNWAYDTIPLPATNIDSSTATLNGWYGWGGTQSATVGFLYSDAFPIATTNTSVSGTYNNESFSKYVTSLNSSTCYYFTVWCHNSTTPFWYRSYLNESFLTKPSGPPENLTTTVTNQTAITLTWDNVTDYSLTGVHQESIIRYSNTHYPTSPTDGFLGYQGTAETCTINGLNTDIQYYFSAWTHIWDNCSWDGSPCVCHQNSSEFSTASAFTEGGEYTINIRYENRTYGPVDLTKWGPHKLIVYYYGQNLTDYYGEVNYFIFYNNGTDYEDIEPVTNPDNNVTINFHYTPETVKGVYKYNDSQASWLTVPSAYYTVNLTGGYVNISNLTLGSNETFVKVVYFTLDTLYVVHDPVAYFDNNATNLSNGKITINVNKTVKFFDFHWNDSTGRMFRCNRVVTTELGQREYDIFIRDDLPVYGEGQDNFNHSLVKYLVSFIDETGKFKHENHPRAYFYTYTNDSEDDEKIIIHSEYFDDELHVNPWLVYDKRYFIGVKCDELEYERIAVVTADDNREPEVRIPYEFPVNYSFYDVINVTPGWFNNGFYVLYKDKTFSTVNATFNVYDYYNGTLNSTQYTEFSTKNFTVNCNTTGNYMWEIIAVLDDPADIYDGTYYSGKIGVFGGMEPITDNATLEEMLELILGPSPMWYDQSEFGGESTHPNASVPWLYIVMFTLCFIWITTVGKLNAFIGGLGVGGILLFSGVAISGISPLFANYAWYEGVSLLVIGFFTLILSIIGLLGGVDRK